MLCCVGLIGGMAVGQSLGGPWTYIAPAAGFGIGLIGDMKFMKGMHSHGPRRDKAVPAEPEPGPPLRVTADPTEQAPQTGH
jgi:hypothetical protein